MPLKANKPKQDVFQMTVGVAKKKWFQLLYVQVLVAVAMGILCGHYLPEFSKQLKPLGDGFIKLVKMMISPIVFCTVVHGIASMGDIKKLGRVGAKTILYFEVVTTFALMIGLVVVNVLKPGANFNFEAKALEPGMVQNYAEKAKSHGILDFLFNIIPSNFLGAFVSGELLQVLFIAILTAFAIGSLGEKGKPFLHVIDQVAELFFRIMQMVVKAAPIGAFGAMGYTIGSHGLSALNNLAAVILGFYITAALFIFVVLGLICRLAGFSLIKFLGYIKDELLLVLGTSSSETSLPGLMEKTHKLGCSRSTVGLVLPTGFSFNMDGTSIYITMGAVFLAQATNTPLDIWAQLQLLLVAMLTSKGASGITGAGFVTLAATMQAVPSIPLESLSLLVGIDRFMSECRSITNTIGNGVAAVVISRWEGEVTAQEIRERIETAS